MSDNTYSKLFKEHGYSPLSLDWGPKHEKTKLRYETFGSMIQTLPDASVLDAGCGFADLYDTLKRLGWNGKYVGVDANPDLLAKAHELHPDLEFHQCDFTSQKLPLSCDFVVSSGVFNHRRPGSDNATAAARAMGHMFEAATHAVIIDFLSTYVDFQKEAAWHADPGWAISEGKKLSKRLSLRMDYIPFEFMMILYKDQRIDEQQFFTACKTCSE